MNKTLRDVNIYIDRGRHFSYSQKNRLIQKQASLMNTDGFAVPLLLDLKSVTPFFTLNRGGSNIFAIAVNITTVVFIGGIARDPKVLLSVLQNT